MPKAGFWITLFFLCILSAAAQPAMKIANTYRLPAQLKSVSAIHYIPGGKLACLADEIGSIFIIDAETQRIEKEIPFGPPGDYEGIAVVKGSATAPNLPDTSIDLAFMVDVYHELEYPHEMLQALHKALKPGGKLLLVEYRAEDPSIPIKELHKMSVAQANNELLANGFKLYKLETGLPIQHFLLYEKANP